MPAALFALLLLAAAAVDPRLADPLRLLAEVRDATGRQVALDYARTPEMLGLTLKVAALPTGASIVCGAFDGSRALSRLALPAAPGT